MAKPIRPSPPRHTELENGHAPTVSYGESSRTAASRWTAPSIRVARGSLSQLGRSRYSAGRREVRPQHLPSRADHALQHVLEGGPGPRVQSRINNDDGQALGPVAKLLIYGLFQKGRVLAQDGKNSSQRQRWLATALVDIEPRLRKVVGYRHLPKLREALKRELKIEAKTSTVSKKKVA